MRTLLALLAGAFLFCGTANATVVITQDYGGIIDDYVNHYETIRASGDYIRVDGECDSACTLMLGIIPDNHVCVTPKATFGFHSAMWVYITGQRTFSPEGTRRLWETYPARVRNILRARGWDGKTPHPDLIVVKGSTLYQSCPRLVGKVDIPFPIKVGWTWHFPPQPYDPNAPIVAPDTTESVGKPLPLHPVVLPKPRPKKVQVRLPHVAPSIKLAPVALPQMPKLDPLPHVNVLPDYFWLFAYIPTALEVLAGLVTIAFITPFVWGFIAQRRGKA